MDQSHPNGGPPPPPPPPPHGENPKSSSSSGLPPGNYDIFIIPPHSAGGGFIYLPSLKPQWNSFIAGVASTLFCVWLWVIAQPVLKAWVQAVSQSGSGFGMLVLALVVGFAGWVYGRTNLPPEAGAGPKSSGSPPPNGYPGTANGGPRAGSAPPPGGPQWGGVPPPNGHTPGGPGFGTHGPGAGYTSHGQQQHTHQQQGYQGGPNYQAPRTPPPPFEDSPPPTPPPPPPTEPEPKPQPTNTAWEKAREETRKREEERKKQEEVKRKLEDERRKKEEAERAAKAAAEKQKWEQMRAREKEVREREAREKIARDRIAKDKAENASKEAKEKADRDARLKAAQERAEKLRAERAASEKAASERAKSEKALPTYGVGERTNPYSLHVPVIPAAPKSTTGASGPRNAPSANARPPYHHPTAQSYVGTATDTAYRPYDKPPVQTSARSQSSYASESSYAASESTARTSPPPSTQEPYSTKDPGKIILHGAFKFNNLFPTGPVASVKPDDNGISDGLIVRISSQGLFLDDDKRAEGLRQWDIKAWTLTAIETAQRRSVTLVRASIRSQDDNKICYVIPASESWKVTKGLKDLKGGSLIRSTCKEGVIKDAEANRLFASMDIE
ncbi:hypothetical protein BT63DRAFT_426120 [Microthyrium microscopicum]|uniref:Uncharacterized protein n=1 Tax=Microthyrium microscopicum TaxID=703497 RepID=A0A6A6UBZ8_9PEZI|nr:hypothetical protein BT63DRAFT_426120 [Microthyrium microscopicum]